MEGSDNWQYDDIWSPALRDDIFSMYPSWSSESRQSVNHSSPPRHMCSHSPHPLNHPPQPQHSQECTENVTSSSNRPSLPLPSDRKRSHLDPPNFPLQSSPVEGSSNSSGRPLASVQRSCNHNSPLRHSLPRPVSPQAEDSWSASGISDRSDTPWPDTDGFDDFVDLTADSSPPNIPLASFSSPMPRRKDTVSGRSVASTRASESSSNPAKRRKTDASQSSNRSMKVEEVDLRDVDDDQGLSKVLEEQRLATIKAQQDQAKKPVKLNTLQCIICMEPMKDITATHCGHLFCHSCLMEALIAGENQGPEPGKGTPKCPVCRKKVLRPTDRRDAHNIVPLAIKLKSKSAVTKGKERAVE